MFYKNTLSSFIQQTADGRYPWVWTPRPVCWVCQRPLQSTEQHNMSATLKQGSMEYVEVYNHWERGSGMEVVVSLYSMKKAWDLLKSTPQWGSFGSASMRKHAICWSLHLNEQAWDLLKSTSQWGRMGSTKLYTSMRKHVICWSLHLNDEASSGRYLTECHLVD